MITMMIDDIKSLLNEVSDRLKDGEENVIKYKSELKGDFDFWEGYVSGLTWVEDNLSYIVNELKKDNVKDFLRSHRCEKECQELFST